MAGGEDDSGTALDTVEMFHPGRREFVPHPAGGSRLQWRRAHGAAVVVAAKWFPNCLGG